MTLPDDKSGGNTRVATLQLEKMPENEMDLYVEEMCKQEDKEQADKGSEDRDETWWQRR